MRDDFRKTVQIRGRKGERSTEGVEETQKADEEVRCWGVPGSSEGHSDLGKEDVQLEKLTGRKPCVTSRAQVIAII